LTYIARMLTANVKPMMTGERPVFDFVSSATMIITLTKTNVTMNSIKIP